MTNQEYQQQLIDFTNVLMAVRHKVEIQAKLALSSETITKSQYSDIQAKISGILYAEMHILNEVDISAFHDIDAAMTQVSQGIDLLNKTNQRIDKIQNIVNVSVSILTVAIAITAFASNPLLLNVGPLASAIQSAVNTLTAGN